MTKALLLKICISVLFLFYPVIIYFGLKEYQPLLLAILLLIIAILRWAYVCDGGPISSYGSYLVMVPALVVAITFFTNSNLALFLYPALVNLVFFSIFVVSLFNPPCIVEKLARFTQPNFPSEAVAYTVKVTKIWAIFFVLNGILSILSYQVSEAYWLLYNGLISYLLMGSLFIVEYLVRIRVMRQHNA